MEAFVKTWKLEDAHDRFGELARRALAHQPQRVALDDKDAVVVVNAADYAALTFATDLIEFVRRSAAAAKREQVDRQPTIKVAPSPLADREER
jgi:hypothetical protein